MGTTPRTSADHDPAGPADVAPPRLERWLRQYPPLVALVGALVITLGVLPASWRDRQTPPSQQLEYAPIPPAEEPSSPPPDAGDVEVLGAVTSEEAAMTEAGTSSAGTPIQTPSAAPLPPPVISENPSNTRCVGNPPRQTEDPLSPPCVAYFDGDNFGETYQGVAADEVRIIVYADGGINHTGGSRGREPRTRGEYHDLSQPPPDGGEHTFVTGLRTWQRYFNDRFQTYGRTVRFHVFFSAGDHSPKGRRAEAVAHFKRIRPFAVVSFDVLENEDVYLDTMAARGVLDFGSFSGRTESFFQRHEGLVWGLQPSVERLAASYVDLVCRRVVGQPASRSGNDGQNGSARRLGLLSTSDPGWPGLIRAASLVRRGVRDCGGQIVAEGTYDHCCFAQDNSATPTYAQTQMVEFRQAGVSTILHLGGLEGYYGKAAQSLGYLPEWVALGTGFIEGNSPVRLAGYSSVFDQRAFVLTPVPFKPALNQQICYQAFRSVDVDFPDADMPFTCEIYGNLFQLFVGIQVAGPRLGPTSVDKGFHAIPAIRSNDPQVPACFYLVADFTCIKDTQLKLWDATGVAPGDSVPGCWRSVEAGRRRLAGDWPAGNIDDAVDGSEPCDAHSVGSFTYNSPTR